MKQGCEYNIRNEVVNKEPLVQIICVTYNQAPYIHMALDSFLMQETDFNIQVLVADDCSTDGTSEIIEQYVEKYPTKIHHIRRTLNMGSLANFIDICERATAPYVAICDGDDYWTDSHKLQRQIDILRKNPDVNVCAHRTHISASSDWALYEYYKKQNFLQPGKCKFNTKLYLKDVIGEIPHTSSFLFRWTPVKFPEWVKTDGIIGDSPVFYIQLGRGALYVLGSVMSVYRRGAGGVFDNNISMDDMFLKTRLEYIKIMLNSKAYFQEYYDGFQISAFDNRLWKEIVNLLDAIIRSGKWDKLNELNERYPDGYSMAVRLLSEYRFRIKALNVLGHQGADLLFRDKIFLRSLKPFIKWHLKMKRGIYQVKVLSKKIVGFFMYWLGALVHKRKNLWVFSGFAKKAYLDNTKYFFEYLSVSHPEIKAVWLTKSPMVLDDLRKRGLRVYPMRSICGVWTMLRAKIAVTDHFKCSDYSNCLGYNARTKLVNLWHGAGLKNMIPEGDRIPNTDILGVRLSSDILPLSGDSIVRRLFKRIKYIFRAPWRELFEQYFMIVCANEPFVENWARRMRCPDSAIIRCGYPRNENLRVPYEQGEDVKRRIIYAPTYRMKAYEEMSMVQAFVDAVPKINTMLEEKDSEFVLRLHPHTWRNYSAKIERAICEYPRFSVSKNPDIYQELASYDVMIGDYSSIIQDYLISMRPIVLLAADRESFLSNDCGFCMPYDESMPGPVVENWEAAIDEVGLSLDDPTRYADVRERVAKLFCPKEYECIHASERIVQEIKKRLGMAGKKA